MSTANTSSPSRPRWSHGGWLAAFCILLAGCSDGGSQVRHNDPFDDLDDGRVAEGKGVIRGVVFDTSITPVEGAKVSIQNPAMETTTNAEGAFLLKDLEPGLHFLTVSKIGYGTVQQSAEVVAGMKSPPVLKIQIARMPGTEPQALTYTIDGFIACGLGTPATFHVCPGLNEDRSTVTLPFEGAPSFIQVETTWDSTQRLGEQLYLVYYFCKDNCGSRSDRWSEGNRDDPWTARTSGGNRTDLEVAVYASPGGPANGTGLALDQSFSVFATFFYNIPDPDPDWTFLEDGEYPVQE